MDPYSRPLAGTRVPLASIGSNADCRRRVRYGETGIGLYHGNANRGGAGFAGIFQNRMGQVETSVATLAALKPDLFSRAWRPMHDANMNDALEILADFIQIVVPADIKYLI